MKTNVYTTAFSGRSNAEGCKALVTLVLIAVTTLTGCAVSSGGNSTPSGLAPRSDAQVMDYLIGPSDVLSISVWNHKELNRTVTVRPDGKLSFSLVGDITAVGFTPLELQEVMEKALSNYINIIPGEVSVVVDAVHSYKVSVLGEVRLPGRFEFQNQISVLDALAQAGGLTEFASGDNIMILRRSQGKTDKIEFDYQKLVKSKNITEQVLIYPGDIILVP